MKYIVIFEDCDQGATSVVVEASSIESAIYEALEETTKNYHNYGFDDILSIMRI